MDEINEVPQETPVEETPAVVEEQPQETVEELKARLENAKAENQRKAMEIQKLREEQSKAPHVEPVPQQKFNPQDLTTWQDHELKALRKDPQYVALHDQAEDILAERKFRRFQRDEQEKLLRMNTELERSKRYPETLDPTHPLSVKMSEIMQQYRLENTPAGRLAAAEIAHSRLQVEKASAAGRKAEKLRQADVTASSTGGASRPAPKPSDSAKLEELKKRAQSGDKAAQVEWFKARGLI